ncbi:hypothetical protein [Caulobacter phage Cr30]|uniref:hypothetical protein n=1 Tax=Caulobacter phage Cr30 TaxID=1357714 RepID=UPI0004A9B74E|nr:hypothetical protein OZ74_gp213 [Caulobacter phage Cr30]AGS81130.1 hypothetical protein [Caulobacter phage Cr30]
MSFNITNFTSEIDRANGFLRPSQFELTIPGMPAWSTSSNLSEEIRFRCNSSQLPGTNVDSIDIRRYGQGFLEYFPTGISFFDLQTNFYADSNGELIKFFNEWIRNIIDFDVDSDASQKFRVAYKDQYIAQVVTTQFNEQGNPVLEYTYIDAFPVQIQPIGVRWFSRDEITEFQVTWKYRTWKEKSFGQSFSDPAFGVNQPMENNQLAGVVQNSSRVTRPQI